MLKLIGSILMALLNIFGRSSPDLEPIELLPWQDMALFDLPNGDRDLVIEKITEDYLQTLAQQGINPNQQGLWIQSDWVELVNKKGTNPIPAASLTKIATTLAALGKWGVNHRFETKIYAAGAINNGILSGDLVIEGSGDPFFVWEEAIALGNTLNQLGIRQVQGNLVVTDRFYMNYQSDGLAAGKLLKQGLNRELWQQSVTQQYLQLPPQTPQPKLVISGQVELGQDIPSSTKLLLRHQSLSLGEILKQMNIYSNNHMAQMLADLAGGADAVAQYAAKIADFPPPEIKLINGSGLGEENLVSPRAACLMLMAIDRLLAPESLSATDLFPLAGRDSVGTVQNRAIPLGTAVKTGTLARVSALAGVVDTSDRGRVWFAIINHGRQIEYFREQQDYFLEKLAQNWQLKPYKSDFRHNNHIYLGDPQRNISLNQ